MKKAIKEQVRNLKTQMSRKRLACSTHKELALLLKCKSSGDFAPMQETNLYKRHGGEYCEYLQMI